MSKAKIAGAQYDLHQPLWPQESPVKI